jgi:hypothetical protein
MNTKILKSISLVVCCAALCGCSTLKKWAGNAITETPQVSTNIVVIPAMTNFVFDGTNIVPVVTPERTETNYATSTVYAANPTWIKGIQTAQRINSSVNPTPSAPFIEWGLGLAACGLGWYARFKTKREQQAREREQRTAGLLETVIAGVEAANNPDVKQKIKETAKLFGTDKELKDEVHKQTS